MAGWTALGRTGVTSIEFAVVAVVFFPLLFACFDLGGYFLTEFSLQTLAQEAAHAALLQADPVPGDVFYQGGNVPAPLSQLVPYLSTANTTLDVFYYPGDNGVPPTPPTFYVTATYVYQSITPFLSGLNGTITEQTQVSY